MLLGKVVGSVVCNNQIESIDGLKLLAVEEVDIQNKATGSYVVAVDAVGAGVGETIMFATGSAARQTQNTKDRPADAVIMAIVDMWDINGSVIYKKSESE